MQMACMCGLSLILPHHTSETLHPTFNVYDLEGPLAAQLTSVMLYLTPASRRGPPLNPYSPSFGGGLNTFAISCSAGDMRLAAPCQLVCMAIASTLFGSMAGVHSTVWILAITAALIWRALSKSCWSVMVG